MCLIFLTFVEFQRLRIMKSQIAVKFVSGREGCSQGYSLELNTKGPIFWPDLKISTVIDENIYNKY